MRRYPELHEEESDLDSLILRIRLLTDIYASCNYVELEQANYNEVATYEE